MLYYAIKACKESKYDIECFISTEDEEIASLGKKLGAKIFLRKDNLANDQVFKQDVIADAIQNLFSDSKPDIVISLQPNSPEIKYFHIDQAIEIKRKFNKKEIFSVNTDLMQNGAFRIMDYDTVFLKTLSMYCGVYVCDLMDVHTFEDLKLVEKRMRNHND